jgi:hypothetical protein
MNSDSEIIEVSVVLPCLNEAKTIGMCVDAALKSLREAGLSGEVLVADNGSTDGSREIAMTHGARVATIAMRGYGSAVRGGLQQARGEYLVYMDADMSYDFAFVPAFVDALKQGADLAIGSRFRGGIDPGAMPELHRVFGTPFLTRLGNLLFGTKISDINCGMRGFTKESFARLALQAEGMELCSEIMIRSAQVGLRITEIPIPLHVDQRGRAPHLRSFRDGWRNLQMMMHHCSILVLLAPGVLFAAIGAILMLLSLTPSPRITEYLASLVSLSFGLQTIVLAITTQSRVKASKFAGHQNDFLYRFALKWLRLETGLILGAATAVLGLASFAWGAFSKGADPASSALAEPGMRAVLLGVTGIICGLQLLFTSLFLGLFGIRVAEDSPIPNDDAGDVK